MATSTATALTAEITIVIACTRIVHWQRNAFHADSSVATLPDNSIIAYHDTYRLLPLAYTHG
jgi:hypothetical protein